MNRRYFATFLLMGGLLSGTALAQGAGQNLTDRKAIIINNCPLIQLSDFKFANVFMRSDYRLQTDLSWTNKGSQAMTAFEVVIVYYDPFNRRLSGGGSWMVTGRDSGNWAPLPPGQKASDGLIGTRAEPVLTAFAYVRAARLSTGDVWYFNPSDVESEIRKQLPDIREIGDLDPQTAKKP